MIWLIFLGVAVAVIALIIGTDMAVEHYDEREQRKQLDHLMDHDLLDRMEQDKKQSK